MAHFRVRSGQTRNAEIVFGTGDTLFVDLGGAVVRQGAPSAVRLSGAIGNAAIRNEGRIAVEGADGAAITGSMNGDITVSITNASTGVIEGLADAVKLSSASGTTGTFRLTNDGLINGNAGFGVNLKDLRATSITIVNEASGVITNGGDSDVLRPGHDKSTAIRVDNAGTILAGTIAGASSGGDGIDLQSRDGGVSATIVNRSTGHIEGGKHGATGKNAAIIINEAGGEIIGRNGSGLNWDTTAADGDGTVVVRNFGLISGRYDGFGDGDGDGVDVDYLVNIANHGRIEGVGADNVDNFADGIAAGGGIIVNATGGEIFGQTHGILIDDGDRNGAFAATRLVNDGSIASELGTAVRLIGDFDDVIVNRGTIGSDTGLAIETGGGDDRVVNDGTITGDAMLGAGNDYFAGSGSVDGVIDGGAGDDRLSGGGGNDVLIGNLGRDILTGGDGADRFRFLEVTDSSATISQADRITDFRSGDRIDLRGIDADRSSFGDQAFAVVDSGAFTGQAGELTVAQVTGANGMFTLIQGDVNGDAVADFSIVLQGNVDPAIIAFDL